MTVVVLHSVKVEFTFHKFMKTTTDEMIDFNLWFVQTILFCRIIYLDHQRFQQDNI